MPTPETSGLTWRKSTYSNANNGNCVEVATTHNAMAVRDSKSPASGHLTLTPLSWRTFLTRLT